MDFCSKCGKEIFEDAKFCPNCGNPQQNTDETIEGNIKTLRVNSAKLYGAVNLDRLPSGYVVNERYEIKEKIGQGGFAAVYRVYDRNVEIDKALKVFIEAFGNDHEAVEDLRREGKIMMNLTHERIVRIFDVHTSGSIKYIDMEYVEGKSLTEYKLSYPDRKVPEEKVLELGRKIAEGLEYAHSKRVIHKDLKPQNILVSEDGDIKITDFGISDCIRLSMTRIASAASSGTLLYMAPEQIKGEDVGKEADIYSFGVIMYELLSGNPPFFRGAIEYQILNEQPVPLTEISEQLNEKIEKCLEKAYSNRYRDAKDLKIALENNNKLTTRKPFFDNPISGLKKFSLDRGNINISIPVSGIVYIDGVEAGSVFGGKEQVFKNIEVGKRKLEVRYENGRIEQMSLSVRSGLTEKAVFNHLFGSVRLFLQEGYEGGIVYFDNEEMGKIEPGQSATIEGIEIGEHLVEIRSNRGEILKQATIVKKNETTKIFLPIIEIGKKGSAGGYIFYDKGEYSDGWRYLEAAPPETEWKDIPWGEAFSLVGNTRGSIGKGSSNTLAIVHAYKNNDGNYAAKMCNELVYNGYDDWFLPSLDELDKMSRVLGVSSVGGFAQEHYWSSTENDLRLAWTQHFSLSKQGNEGYYCRKDFKYRVRAIRAF